MPPNSQIGDPLRNDLRAAADAGVIAPDQVEALAVFLAGRQPAAEAVPTGTPDIEEDPEAPRFVRGFHDILITIGVVLGLGGLFGMIIVVSENWLVGALATAGVAWLLAEHLVRRLRLALPAIALSIAVVTTIGVSVAAFLSASVDTLDIEAGGVPAFLAAAFAAGLFFWRFRVPFSLALLFGSLGGAIIAGYMQLVDSYMLDRGGEILLLALALVVFAVALAFDFSDPQRRTRRSDYAFWLHLMAAPALIGSVMNFLVGVGSVFAIGSTLSAVDAAIIVATMAVMSVLAILIDRRAFLVAGLGYLGAAIFAIADNTPLSGSVTAAVTVMAVGLTVLVLALGWQTARARLLALAPERLRAVLPPLHRAPSVARLAE